MHMLPTPAVRKFCLEESPQPIAMTTLSGILFALPHVLKEFLSYRNMREGFKDHAGKVIDDK